MRAIRELRTPPFERNAMCHALARVEQVRDQNPAAIKPADAGIGFIYRQAGLRASTIAHTKHQQS
jgi:hypothetical protein